MKTLLDKLMTDNAINSAVINTVNADNADDIFYIIGEFNTKAKAYAKELKEYKEKPLDAKTSYFNKTQNQE